MFASITKSIKSLAKGPRAILAENIALVLSQHFVLDPKDIESSLLKDARIVLKNTQLREKQYKSQDLPNVVVSIKGVVEEVVFSWRWSLSGASSTQNSSNGYSSGSGMVQDVMLSIKGLKVSVGLHAWDTLQESEKDLIEDFGNASISTSTLTQDDGSTISASSSSSSSSGVSDSEKEGFIQTYVQQIVDHLTLKIEDFEVDIQVGKGGPCIIIAGNDLELGTLSAAKSKDTSNANVSTQLSQKLSVRLFSVNAKDGRSEKVCPLIEPFGYTASVLRTSGVRFQGGIMSGLHVIGLPEEHFDSSGEGILFHAGREQLSVLSAFGMMFAPSGLPEDTLSTPLNEENTNTALQSIGPEQKFNEDCNSTLFELPLPALTFVLPRSQANETSSKITLPSTTVSYRADGKVFNMKGISGVKENGNPLIGFGHGGQWRIDFVERNLHIEDANSSENGGPTIGICGEALMRISSDITCLLSGDDIVKLQNAWDVEKPSAATIKKKDPMAQPWTVSNGEYLEIVLNDRDTKILVKNIVVGGDFDSINVDSIKCQGPNETSCALNHIALKTINSGFYVQVGEIETICLPTIARLSEPIKNASFAYQGDHINLQLESAKVVMLQSILAGNNSASDGIDAAQASTDMNIAIPFGIRTQIKTLHVKLAPEDDAYIQIAGLKANIVPDDDDGTINIDTLEKVHIRVDRGSQWLQCSLEPSFVAVPKTLTTITAMQCGGISLSSPTLGLPQVELPPCSILPDSNNAVMEGPLCVKIESFDAMEKIQNFLSFPSQKAVSKATEEKPSANILPVSLTIPKVELSVQEGEASCTLKHIALKTINSGFYVQVGEIETICLPTIARLSEPIKNASFAYQGDHINLQLESAKVVMLQSILAGNNSASDGIDAAQASTDMNIAIPFGIRTQIKTLHVKLAPEDDAYIQIAGLKANIVPDDDDGTINIDTLEKVHIRVDRGSQWLQCSLEPSFVAVPKTLTTITAMQCGGISLSSPTLGLPQVELPPCSILPDSNNAVMEGPLCVKIESFDAMEKIQNFLSFPSQKAVSKATEEKPSANILPVSLTIPKVELSVQEPKIQLNGTSISLQGLLLKCNSFDGQDANGIIASMQGLECNLTSEVSLKIQSLSKLLIPEIFKLEAPIHDTSIIYKNGRILIDLNTVRGTLASLQSQTNNPPSSDSTVSIPFPLNLNVKSLALKDHTNHCVVSIKNVGVSVAQIESDYSLRTRGNMLVRVKSILSGEWAQASVGELSLLAVQINDSFKTKKIDFSGGTIGPCSPSLGQLSIVIPRVQQNGLNTTCSMQSAINVSLGSLETIEKLSALLPQSSESSFEGLTFPVFVPEIKILISELSARIHLQSVSACGSIVTIKDARAKIEGLATTSIKGLKVDVRANCLEIASVESLSMPNANLSKQLLDLSLRFENGVLKINLPSTIHVNILSETRGNAQSAAVSQQGEIVIPFPISMGITQANVKIFTSGKESLLIVKEVVANILPQNMPGQPLLEDPFTKRGAKISLLSSMEHELFRARNLNISFLVGFNDFSTVRNLHASVESATVTAGFSSIDWNTLFNSSEENTNLNIISTPFANFSQFKLSISYQGKVLATKAHIDVPSFVGNGSTTSDDLKSHYTKVVMNRIPGFLTNVEFLGNNVVDSTFANVGRAAIGTKSLAGAGLGSIVGTVAVDGIRSAISAGKSARNAASNEGYKFGDVTRGITRGLSQATQVGAQSRGSDGRDYIPGDLTVGVATAGGEYVVNNKGKLASVGGSGVGSMVGLAVAGPIGFLAGSYFGGKAGKRAVGEDAQGMLQFKYLSFFILALAMNLSNIIRRDKYKTEYYWESSAARPDHRFPAHANSTNPESQFKIAISDNSLSAAVKSN